MTADIHSNVDRDRQKPPVQYPKVSWEDVELGSMLGSGGFASVYEVAILRSLDTAHTNRKEGDYNGVGSQVSVAFTANETSEYDSASVTARSGLSGSLALKCIPKSILQDKEKLHLARESLIQEAKILSNLPDNPNVIRLVGISADLDANPDKGFLILQRVSDSLEGLLKRWKTRQPHNFRLSLVHTHKNHQLLRNEQAYRVQQAAIGLAKAMAFLHHHHILYRDLKPSNVGLDFEGQVRLFDFGLARTYNEFNHQDGRTLTNFVGSVRYMAPEIYSASGHYGFPADVHSFALLLWEILTLRKPFENLKTIKRFERVVQLQHRRPSLRPICSRGLQELLKASWHPNPSMRPTFALIVHQLDIEGASGDLST